jgi:Recombinase zinc beta ribbon domain/Recombinase
MMRNPAYVGLTYRYSRRHREGELIQAAWPAIIDSPMWHAVQRQLEQNRRKGGRSGITANRAYVFSRLLWCAECGRPMNIRNYAVKSSRKYVYYRCRSGDAGGLCGAPSVREDQLVPWAEQLVRRIDAAVQGALKPQLRQAREGWVAPEDAVRRIDLRLERVQELYAMGHWDRERYLVEHQRLVAQREDLVADQSPQPTLRLEGVLAAWEVGAPEVRRALLATLFERLFVGGGQVVSWQVRPDRAAEVERLLAAVGLSSPAPAAKL